MKPFDPGYYCVPYDCNGVTERTCIRRLTSTTEYHYHCHRCEIGVAIVEAGKCGKALKARVCQACGKWFTTTHKTRKNCTDECRDITRNRRASKKQKARPKRRVEPKICPECGKSFTPNHEGHERCSPECSMKHRNRYQAARRKEHREAIAKGRKPTCKACGAAFEPTTARNEYCADPACRRSRALKKDVDYRKRLKERGKA